MIAIYYRKDGNACATCCPFTNPQKRGAMTPKVGSMFCESCKHFIAIDKLRMIVTCNREPKNAVFCKKDRRLNPVKRTSKDETHTLREWQKILASNPVLISEFENLLNRNLFNKREDEK